MSDATQTKQQFLVAKAHNFREYVLQYKPTPALQTMLYGFNEAMLIPTIATLVVPVVKSGTAKGAVADFMAKLEVPPEQKDVVAAKLERYLIMFSEVLLTA